MVALIALSIAHGMPGPIRKPCGNWRNRYGEVVEPPRKEKGSGETTLEYAQRYGVFLKQLTSLDVVYGRCACDPEHPHRPGGPEVEVRPDAEVAS